MSYLSAPIKAWARIVIALILSLIVIACLIEAEASGHISLFSIRVNPLARMGKVISDGVKYDPGTLRSNILDNSFFRNNLEGKHEKKIFIVGTSVAFGLPLVKFKYAGNDYQTYNFAIQGNPIYPTMKIFSILSEFKPDIVFWAFTPSQIDTSINYMTGAFSQECLGALQNYKIPGSDFSHEEVCSYNKTRSFLLKRAIYNMLALLKVPSKFYPKEAADRDLLLFRTTLSAFGADLENAMYQAANLKKIQPKLELGSLNADSVQAYRRKILSDISKEPNLPNVISDGQKDQLIHWKTASDPAILEKPNTAYAWMIKSIIAFAKNKKIKLIFYTSPLAHNMTTMFPSGYYEEYQLALKKLITANGGHYLDEGDLLLGKGSLMYDGYHMNQKGEEALMKMLIYDSIKNGLFTKKARA